MFIGHGYDAHRFAEDRKLILCGIEITCFSKHLLAIFPDNFGEEQQNIFLQFICLFQTT